ncbi:uncharacterized protein LOC119402190 [Rhipicephalus sanguineus]|uniref:uncharacterized protein LOC119402190 n=1 Tax=Rhipicephalus sanguineus TaxID=34632 RepID=UPI0018945778|nr:uncharacterized protein LOC119402190 [Rhipicephalus sanguineus]
MVEDICQNILFLLGLFSYLSTLHPVPTHVVAVVNNLGNNRSYLIVLKDPPTTVQSPRNQTGNVRDPEKDRERSLLPLPPRPGQAITNPVYAVFGDNWEKEHSPLPPLPADAKVESPAAKPAAAPPTLPQKIPPPPKPHEGRGYFPKGPPPNPHRDLKPKETPPTPPRHRPTTPVRSASLYVAKPLPPKPPRRVNSLGGIKLTLRP